MAQARDPDRIVLVGTDVFRRARNVDEFRDRLPEPLSLLVLDTGGRSGRLVPGGRLGTPQRALADGQLVVIDLGGGSLEVVAGFQGDPPRPLASVSMGSHGHPLGPGGLDARLAATADPQQGLRRYLDAETRPACRGLSPRCSAAPAGGP